MEYQIITFTNDELVSSDIWEAGDRKMQKSITQIERGAAIKLSPQMTASIDLIDWLGKWQTQFALEKKQFLIVAPEADQQECIEFSHPDLNLVYFSSVNELVAAFPNYAGNEIKGEESEKKEEISVSEKTFEFNYDDIDDKIGEKLDFPEVSRDDEDMPQPLNQVDLENPPELDKKPQYPTPETEIKQSILEPLSPTQNTSTPSEPEIPDDDLKMPSMQNTEEDIPRDQEMTSSQPNTRIKTEAPASQEKQNTPPNARIKTAIPASQEKQNPPIDLSGQETEESRMVEIHNKTDRDNTPNPNQGFQPKEYIREESVDLASPQMEKKRVSKPDSQHNIQDLLSQDTQIIETGAIIELAGEYACCGCSIKRMYMKGDFAAKCQNPECQSPFAGWKLSFELF